MKRKARIRIVSFGEDKSEGIERLLFGEVLDTEHAIWLYYKEPLSEDVSDTVREIFRMELDENNEVMAAGMTRPDQGTKLAFLSGKWTDASFPTPAGDLEARIFTRSVLGRRLENGAEASLEYELWLGREFQEKRTIQVTCSWAGGGVL